MASLKNLFLIAFSARAIGALSAAELKNALGREPLVKPHTFQPPCDKTQRTMTMTRTRIAATTTTTTTKTTTKKALNSWGSPKKKEAKKGANTVATKKTLASPSFHFAQVLVPNRRFVMRTWSSSASTRLWCWISSSVVSFWATESWGDATASVERRTRDTQNISKYPERVWKAMSMSELVLVAFVYYAVFRLPSSPPSLSHRAAISFERPAFRFRCVNFQWPVTWTPSTQAPQDASSGMGKSIKNPISRHKIAGMATCWKPSESWKSSKVSRLQVKV